MLIHKPLEFELKTKTMLIFCSYSFLGKHNSQFYFISDFGVLFAAYSTLISNIIFNVKRFFDLKIEK
jgi:hypothetical protein